MSDLKAMYRQIVADGFPDTMTITLGETVLKYRKRVWNVGGEVRGLRYGENPDQPAALYEAGGRRKRGGREELAQARGRALFPP